MKILYAIQGTGNGHISRAKELIPYLQSYGEVDFLFSGKTATIDFPVDIKYRFNGLSLYYNSYGGLSYCDTFRKNSIKETLKITRELPVEKYDLIINDFEFITALACKLKKKSSIHFGHQASFQSDNVPKPKATYYFQELILKHFAKAEKYIGLHFMKYDNFIFPPIIKKDILEADPETLGHYTIYLPSISYKFLLPYLHKLKHHRFHLFTHECVKSKVENNVTLLSTDSEIFSKSMMQSNGIITGGGFETPSEALYLEKKLMCIPIKNHYEQQCNAAALKQMGVTVLDGVDENFHIYLTEWIESKNSIEKLVANDIGTTVEKVVREGMR